MNHQHDKANDPFLHDYQPSELRIASEFLTTWLPFLSRDLCQDCGQLLSDRIRTLNPELANVEARHSDENLNSTTPVLADLHERNGNRDDTCDANSLGSWKDEAERNSLGSCKDGESERTEAGAMSEISCEPSFKLGSCKDGESERTEAGAMSEISCEPSFKLTSSKTPAPRMSWADMMQEDELGEEEDDCESERRLVNVNASMGNITISKVVQKPKLSRQQREYIRFTNVGRKKDFICLERFKGRLVNIVEGLELHTGIFSAVEQKRIVDFVYQLQEMGQKGELRERTYTSPRKWMKGKGRVTLQFGCCYNYATDKYGNPPGILKNGSVDPIPSLFKVIIRRLVGWHVLPPTCIPDSCIVNIYEEDDCIPPHIDNHDFVRPFCTVSFISECNIVFGTNLAVQGPGEFAGSLALPLPVGSVLVLKGNGADVAKHCVPAVPRKRISITFRRMDESKRPIDYVPEPDLLDIQPLPYEGGDIDKPDSPLLEPEMKRPTFRSVTQTQHRGSSNWADTRFEPRYSTYRSADRRRRR